jgi:hypothetical protein
MNSHYQINLIDMQNNPDGIQKFVLVYQHHLTKFVLLWLLDTRRAEEAAPSDTFTTFGALNFLHSDNGREFCNRVIEQCVLRGTI